MTTEPSSPQHRPYRHASAVFQIGLQPMEISTWLETGPDHGVFMAAKRKRLAGSPPLFYRSLNRSLAAQRELLETAVSNLASHHPSSFTVEGHILTDRLQGSSHDLAAEAREPLDILGGFLEEDVVLFERDGGVDIVTAVSNAYTSSGRIVSCIGNDMRYAHEPVPGLNEQLGARIDRVIGNVQVSRPVVRFNWFITPIADRLFPEASHRANAGAARRISQILAADPEKAGDMLWLRVERQTFLRLPATGALVFGIHTCSDPLSRIADDHESLSAIYRLLGEYSEERLVYSSMLETRDPVRRWIEHRRQTER